MEENDGWSKWWWLGYFGVRTWTAEEQRVRLAMGMGAATVSAIAILVLASLFSWAGVERHAAALLAAPISLWVAFYTARPIATALYPDLLRQADLNARTRLAKKAHE